MSFPVWLVCWWEGTNPNIGRPHPEFGLPDLDGGHRWRKDLPPDPRYRQSWFPSRHEGQLGDFPYCARFRAEIPP